MLLLRFKALILPNLTANQFQDILAFFLKVPMGMVWLTKEIFGMSGMIDDRFVLDINAVIFLTTKGNIISSSIENDLDKADIFISIITEIELFSKPELPPNEEENLRIFLLDRISIIDITNEIKKEVIALRRSTKHKLPDCIVAATAIVLNATLLTADLRLLRLEWPGFKAKNIS